MRDVDEESAGVSVFLKNNTPGTLAPALQTRMSTDPISSSMARRAAANWKRERRFGWGEVESATKKMHALHFLSRPSSHLLSIRHIARLDVDPRVHGTGPAARQLAQLFCGGGKLVGRAGDERDVGVAGDKGAGQGEAQAGGAAGDEDVVAGEGEGGRHDFFARAAARWKKSLRKAIFFFALPARRFTQPARCPQLFRAPPGGDNSTRKPSRHAPPRLRHGCG